MLSNCHLAGKPQLIWYNLMSVWDLLLPKLIPIVAVQFYPGHTVQAQKGEKENVKDVCAENEDIPV